MISRFKYGRTCFIIENIKNIVDEMSEQEIDIKLTEFYIKPSQSITRKHGIMSEILNGSILDAKKNSLIIEWTITINEENIGGD